LELDTNPVENQIRPIALTRKNALFAGNEIGAENWAMLASLVIRREDSAPRCSLIRLILQDVRRKPRQLHRRNPARHPRWPPAKRHRRSHAMAIQPAVKPRRIG
ncbi:MAG: transposase, partial [Natronohydrobacter sp.]|nr:transposase [Natronohydrobacter sp.]